MTYPLEHGTAETQRLIRQSGFYNPFTRWALSEAGISTGMRVLDLGSGAGDVALIAAELVGPTGTVIGIDRNPGVLAVARERAAAAGFDHLTFREGDVATMALDEKFDAIIGRLILMYQPDPIAALNRWITTLRPGGIVAFQEFNLSPEGMRSYPTTPLWHQFFDWMMRAFSGGGAETRMGDKLYEAFRAASLPSPQMYLASPMGGGEDWGGYIQAALILRSLLPLMLKLGIVTEDEVGIDTLEDRLREEAVQANVVVKMPDLVSAWTCVD